MMNKKNLPFLLFILSLIILLIIRDLFRDGMFMDGQIYAAVANNLANGLGTFWHPHFSQTLMQVYHEQPPLLFGLEAIFFKILGNSMLVERIYGLVILVITIFLIQQIWTNLFSTKKIKDLAWLPVLFWLIIPVCFWSYSNNMEEPTMGMFDLASILFIIKALKQERKRYLNLLFGACMLIAASLCKGVQGLFPFALVFFYWLIFHEFSFIKMLKYSLFLFSIILVFYLLILINHSVRSSFEMYFNNRLVAAFAHPAYTHTDRLYLLKQLFSELLPVLILSLGMLSFVRIRKISLSVQKQDLQDALLWFLIALSGTLPLMLTIEQSGYYLVTVFPYYAIGLAIIFAPLLSNRVDKIDIQSVTYKRLRNAAFVMLLASITFSLFSIISIPKRDKDMLHDVNCIGNYLYYGEIVSIPNAMKDDYSLQAYFVRYYYISLDPSTKLHDYLIVDDSQDKNQVPACYKKVNLPTKRYALYTFYLERI